MWIYLRCLLCSVFFCLVLPYQAQALIADQFTCELSLDSSGNFASLNHHFDLVTLRFPFATKEGVDFTKAHTKYVLTTESSQQGNFTIDLDFSYLHATLLKDPTQVRAARCVNVQVVSGQEKYAFECPEIKMEPFYDPDGQWAKASILNGIPRFPVKLWQFFADLPEGNLKISCHYLGSEK